MKIEECIELRLKDIGDQLAADLSRDDYKRWTIPDLAKLRLQAKWLLSYLRELQKKQISGDMVEVVRCKDCKWHDDCICVVCEDGDTVVCGKDHKHVTKNHYCSSSTR